MVDDTPKKMRFMDAGLVVVPEFTEACVLEAFGIGGAAETKSTGHGGGEEEGEETRKEEEAARGQREVLPRLLGYLG